MAAASLVRRLATRWRWDTLFTYERNVYLLLLFTLGKGIQLSIAALSINLYAHSLGYRLDFIGLLTAMPAVGALLASVPVGALADRMGRKPLLIISGLLNPLALAAIGLSASQPLMIVASLCNGVLASAYWVTNLPILTESTSDEQRVGVLALNNFLLLGVGALGALIGGAVPELVGGLLHVPASSAVPLRWGVLAAAIAVFLPALPLFALTESRRAVPPAPVPTPADPAGAVAVLPATLAGPAEAPSAAEASAAEKREGRKELTSLFSRLLIPDMLFTTGEGAVVGLLQVFFVLRFALQPGTLGAFFMVAGLLGGATSLTAPRLVRRWGQLRIATAMQYLSAPVMLVIGFSPLFPLAALAECIRQILRGLFEPVYAAFAMERVTARHRATLSGFYSVTWSIGYSIGPVVAGWLQRTINLSAAFLIGAGCLTLSATLLRVFFGRRQSL